MKCEFFMNPDKRIRCYEEQCKITETFHPLNNCTNARSLFDLKKEIRKTMIEQLKKQRKKDFCDPSVSEFVHALVVPDDKGFFY